MRRCGASIPPRKPVFLGCEGESEQAYGQLLNELARERRLPVHIEVVNLNPGAGDPLARIRRARQEMDRWSRRRSQFEFAAVLMDSDQIEHEPQRRLEVESLAARHRIAILWQQPCHEAFLLRHFAGHDYRRPPTTALAGQDLREVWPHYQKPMTRRQLVRHLTLEHVLRAARQDEAFAAFLGRIGLIG